jgi:ActR/RegA family two-component response regulator
MGSVESVLIVEDDEGWSDFYKRIVERQGKSTVRVATLADAETALASMTFAVALVDIGLDERDEANADGLLVMERIKEIGDPTSIIMITGKGTVQITRDALKKYNSLDAFDKSEVNPSDVVRLVEEGIKAYNEGFASKQLKVRDEFRGDLGAIHWDDKILRGTDIHGGIPELYKFLEDLFLSYLPVVRRRKSEHVRVDPDSSIAYGEYWSRAIGRPLLVCFGRQDRIAAALEDKASGRGVLGARRVGDAIRDHSSTNVRGLVFELTGEPRASFEG